MTVTSTDDVTATVNLTNPIPHLNCTFTNPVWTHTYTGITFANVNATATSTDETTSGANDGTATVIATGGSGFTYLWSNGAATATVSNLAPGNYSVIVTEQSSVCNTTVYVSIGYGTQYPEPESLDVCLNLDTGNFEFTDNNTYTPGGHTPCTLAITIKHSNGTITHPGSLSNPDIYTDSDLPATRTYDEANKLGKNFSIPCLLYTSPRPRDATLSRMPSSA